MPSRTQHASDSTVRGGPSFEAAFAFEGSLALAPNNVGTYTSLGHALNALYAFRLV